MAIRRTRESERLAVAKKTSALPSRDPADFRDYDTGLPCLRAEAGKVVGRERQEDFIVVTTAERGFERSRISRDRRAHRVRERNARHVDVSGGTGGAAQLGEI